MTRSFLLSGFLAATLVTAANAATTRSYAALDRQTSAACIAASGLRAATVGPVVRFSDRFLMDVRTVTGTYPQPHMKGAKGTMLCLYNRRTKRAETQEMTPAPVAAGDVKHIWWRGTHAMCQVQGRAAQDFCQNGQTVVVGNHKHTAPILIASVPHLSQNSGCSNE